MHWWNFPPSVLFSSKLPLFHLKFHRLSTCCCSSGHRHLLLLFCHSPPWPRLRIRRQNTSGRDKFSFLGQPGSLRTSAEGRRRLSLLVDGFALADDASGARCLTDSPRPENERVDFKRGARRFCPYRIEREGFKWDDQRRRAWRILVVVTKQKTEFKWSKTQKLGYLTFKHWLLHYSLIRGTFCKYFHLKYFWVKMPNSIF